MKIKSTILAMALVMLSISQVQARGTATGTVEKITAGGSVSNVFLSEDITAVNGEAVAPCATTSKFFSLGSDQKNQLAVLLTALALGSEVKINGNGQCNFKPTAEDVSSVQVIGG